MDITPECRTVNFSAGWPASHKPIRSIEQQSAAGLLCLGCRSQSMAHRCVINTMGQHPCICLSSDITNFTSISQDRAGELQDPAHSPILAPPTVVRQTGETASPSTNNSPQLAGHLVPARIGTPTGSPPDMLDIVQRSLRATGFSQDVAVIAAHSHRPSTQVYNSRLDHFFKWCKQQNHYPAIASLTCSLWRLFKPAILFSTADRRTS